MAISRRYFLKTSGLSLFGAGLMVPSFMRRTAYALEQPSTRARKKVLVAIFQRGAADVIIAGGCESMSHIPMGGSVLRPNFDWPADLPWVYISMGLTAENVAANYKISREDMDAMGPVKIKEVEAAQQQIIGVVRQLESDGTINLKGAGGEQYVV